MKTFSIAFSGIEDYYKTADLVKNKHTVVHSDIPIPHARATLRFSIRLYKRILAKRAIEVQIYLY
eukprot:COSAG05_NODE_8420_length_705_cov_1.564356_2_plen_65_part_00